ncbi:MAG: type II secretion system F family protein [bacterium]|nr:type II secretion system F family protein [bacterium]
MAGAFGYTLAIVAAALALRRVPIELSRWRMRRRSRLLSDGSGDDESPGARATSPQDRQGEPQAGRVGGRLRRRFRRALEDAAVPCGESQAVAVWGAAVGVGIVGGLVLASAPGAVAGAGAGLAGPPAALWSARHRRQRLVVEALPDFLERVARSLRAGVSTGTALEEVVPATGPLGEDLARVLADVRAGSPLPAALDRWRSRRPLPEVNLAAAALSIGASTGGRRAPAVDGVAATLRGTRATQREIASLAQQGRLSGLLIALLPLCFLGLSAMIDSGSVVALYGTPVGMVCLVAGGVLNIVALVWMQRITRLP